MGVPKCGSQWTAAAVRNSCAVVEEWPHHLQLPTARTFERRIISCIRHPLTWYPSYWNYRMRHGWQFETHEIDRECNSNSFSEFMGYVLTRMQPGWMQRYLDHWVEQAEDISVMRFESLTKDLCLALDCCGQEYDPVLLRATRRRNEGDYIAYPVAWRRDQQQALCRFEAELIEQFYPAEVPV